MRDDVVSREVLSQCTGDYRECHFDSPFEQSTICKLQGHRTICRWWQSADLIDRQLLQNKPALSCTLEVWLAGRVSIRKGFAVAYRFSHFAAFRSAPSGKVLSISTTWKAVAMELRFARVARTTDTICPYCGVGCDLTIHKQEGQIVHVTSPHDHSVTHGNLCIKGRFGWQFVQIQPSGEQAKLLSLPVRCGNRHKLRSPSGQFMLAKIPLECPSPT
jgi:hypothetical protein